MKKLKSVALFQIIFQYNYFIDSLIKMEESIDDEDTKENIEYLTKLKNMLKKVKDNSFYSSENIENEITQFVNNYLNTQK